MSKIRSFKCDWEVKLYIKSRVYREIGSGSEGTCFEGTDKKVYKFLDFDTRAPYIIDEIITAEEVQSESFALPEELYVVDDILRGYRTKKVARDYFGENIFDINSIVNIDFAALAHAYRKMAEDIKLLSEERILIFDLPFNIMFDGENLVGIDTCGYRKVNYDPTEENMHSLNLAIESIFEFWISYYEEMEERNYSPQQYDRIKGNNIDEYLHSITKRIPVDISIARFFKTIENDVKKEKGKH